MLKNPLHLRLLMSVSFAACAGCARPAEDAASSSLVTVKGSDTMVHLVSQWSEGFMAAHPDLSVSVTGGGSGTGIAALINGTTDICMASRDIKEEELELAGQQGLTPREHAVALDGIVVVVNPQNPIDQLTVEQLAKIFTGEYQNWNQAGGPDQPILVTSRESSSGTYVFFQEHVLNKKDYTPSARLMPATSGIIQAVSADAGAIGYVGLGYAEEAKGEVKTISVKPDESSAAVAPSEETVISGDYPISRPLFLYTKDAPSAATQAFVDYCLGPEGQETVRGAGYVPVQ